MPRLAVAVAAAHLVGYLYAVQRISWVELFSPRGGIVGFGLYLALALGLIGWSRFFARGESERVQTLLGGWLLLAMPPIWFVLSLDG